MLAPLSVARSASRIANRVRRKRWSRRWPQATFGTRSHAREISELLVLPDALRGGVGGLCLVGVGRGILGRGLRVRALCAPIFAGQAERDRGHFLADCLAKAVEGDEGSDRDQRHDDDVLGHALAQLPLAAIRAFHLTSPGVRLSSTTGPRSGVRRWSVNLRLPFHLRRTRWDLMSFRSPSVRMVGETAVLAY